MCSGGRTAPQARCSLITDSASKSASLAGRISGTGSDGRNDRFPRSNLYTRTVPPYSHPCLRYQLGTPVDNRLMWEPSSAMRSMQASSTRVA